MPVAPRMKTVTGVAATRPISLYTACIARLLPTMAKPLVCAGPTSTDSDISRELFTHILESEEEHIDWLQTQQRLIEQMGIENFVQLQTKPNES